MRTRIAAMTMLATLAALQAPASLAQDGASIMIQRDDEGGTRVRHISMPNLEALRTPDFTRKDLPIFTERLVLSEAQTEVIGMRIDEYVQAFIALTKELAAVAGPRAEFAAQEDPEGAPRRRGGPAVGLAGGPMSGPGVTFEDLEAQLPPGSQVGVSMAIGMGGDGPAEGEGDGNAAPATPPQPTAQVDVSIETPEGEDVPPDVLAKFQERANQMAAQVMEQVAAQQEAMRAGEPAGAELGDAGAAVALANVEDFEQRQSELAVKIEEFLKGKTALRTQFVVDAQSSLAEPQVQRWPSLERALTRERSLPRGRISGESTNLVKLLAAQKLDEVAIESVASQVESYEVALDAALKQRDAFLEDANRNIDDAIAENKPDRALSIADRAADLRIAVRSLNQQSAEQIAQGLGGERGEPFRADAREAFYPRVYRTTRGQRMFEEVEGMTDLQRDVVASIADLRRAYESELAATNEQIRQTMDREEPKQSQRGLERLKQTMRGEDNINPHQMPEQEMDPIRAAIEKRAELDDRYLKTVAALLSPAQAEALPQPRTHKGPIVIHGGRGA